MILEVIDNIIETHDTKTIRFKIASQVDFKPGQFGMLTLNVVRDGKDKTEKKAYSIASIPGKDYIDFTVKKHNPGPFGTSMQNLKPGDKVAVEYPYGLFFHLPELGNDIVLIGAGSGIVPLMSIIRNNTEHNHPVKMRLIYTNKTKNDIIYHKELIELEKKNKNLKLYLATTQDESWEGLNGRVGEKIILELIPDYKEVLFYLCGPPKMVSKIQQMLIALGVEKSKIKTERFD